MRRPQAPGSPELARVVVSGDQSSWRRVANGAGQDSRFNIEFQCDGFRAGASGVAAVAASVKASVEQVLVGKAQVIELALGRYVERRACAG